MRLSVVIPVYNEKKTIQRLVSKVLDVKDLDLEVVIVDDYSTDGTRELLKQFPIKSSVLKIFFKDFNSGKGATLREGFKHTTGDFVIVQDADLEYDPNEYLTLVTRLNQEPEEQREKTVVYGSRFAGNYKDMSSLHYHGNQLLTTMTNLLFGTSLTDMETCYKLMPGNFIRNLTIKSNRFNFEPEITAKILKSGMKILEVPISYSGRTHSDGKKITWKDGISAVWTLLKFKFTD